MQLALHMAEQRVAQGTFPPAERIPEQIPQWWYSSLCHLSYFETPTCVTKVTFRILLPASMSVLFETSLGDIVIDLEVDSCPKTCENFLKLCKVYYYNLNAFFNGK